jgi:hypothetical protein
MLKGIDLSLSFLSWRPADPFGDVFCWFGDLARIIGSEKVSDGFSIRARATMILALKKIANSLVFTDLSLKSLPLIMFKYLLCQ